MTDTDAILRDTAHRPWPLPSDPWIMFQSWRTLLFAHWPLPAELLRPLVPSQLALDEFDGSAWISLTPFRLANLHARFLPPIPGTADFPEMNLRTYVRVGDRPGIFFFSLDAANRLAVMGARTFYRLPYHDADMAIERDGEWFRYRSRRTDDGAADFAGRYRPTGPAVLPQPGTPEHFLTERYALYVVLKNRKVLRADIHHAPWQLQPAEAEIERNTVAAATVGLTLPDRQPLLHYSARQDTLVWAPRIAG